MNCTIPKGLMGFDKQELRMLFWDNFDIELIPLEAWNQLNPVNMIFGGDFGSVEPVITTCNVKQRNKK